MITLVEYWGQFGNQLFQYVFTRLLAHKLNSAFKVPPLPLFPDAVVSGDGVVAPEPAYRMNDLDGHISLLPLEVVVERCRGSRLNMVGHFERSDYYYPERDLIRGWLTKPSRRLEQIAVHVRGKDGKPATPPLDYYREALAGLPDLPRVVYTDDPEFSMVDLLAKALGCRVSTACAKDSFFEIMESTAIVNSMSTFVWWASFLSDATVVHPEPVAGWRSRNDHPERYLSVPGWKTIPVPEFIWPVP